MKLLSCLKPSYTVNLLSIIIWKWMWVHFTGMLLQYKSRPTPVEPKPYWQVACLVNINFLVNMYSKWWCIIQNLPTHTLVMNVKEWDFYIVPVHFLQLSETRWLVIKKGSFSLRVLSCTCHIWSASGELFRLPHRVAKICQGEVGLCEKSTCQNRDAGKFWGPLKLTCSVVTNPVQCKLTLLIDTGSYL